MKLVIITNGNFFARLIMTRLFYERHADITGVVVVTGVKAGNSRLRSLVEILQRGGWRHFAYKSSTYLVFAAAALLFPRRAFFVSSLAKRLSIPIIYTAQVNLPNVVNKVKEWRPDLLLSVSCPQRIASELLSIPKRYAINIHSSLLPRYAGIAPYFWVLTNGENLTGTTIHVMEEQFDSGHIIVQKHLRIAKNETVFSLFFRLSKLGAEALAVAVTCIAEGTVTFTPQDSSKRTYHSWPTAEASRLLLRNKRRFVKVRDYFQAIRSVT